MALEELYQLTLDITYTMFDNMNDINQVLINHNLQTRFVEDIDYLDTLIYTYGINPNQNDAVGYEYNVNDKTRLTDDLLFTLWFELFFDTNNAPCYLSVKFSYPSFDHFGADGFIYYVIGKINKLLNQLDHSYRLINIDNNINKVYLTTKLL